MNTIIPNPQKITLDAIIEKEAKRLAVASGDTTDYYGEWIDKATENLKNSNTIIEVEHINTETIKLKETPFIAFYADIPHNKIQEVIDDIKSWYENKKTYLIGLEYKEAREHYHFVIDFTETEYAAYVKRVLKGKYKLSGRRNKKGHTGGYGKVSKIRNLDAMCSYTLKDLDYHTNFKEERIKFLVEQSYPKPENDKKELENECMEYITKNLIGYNEETELEWSYPHYVGIQTINFLRSKKYDMQPSTIRRLTLRYLAYHGNGGRGINSSTLFSIMFPHGI